MKPSKWFKFALNKNKIIFINFDLIEVIEFTLTTVTIGEFILNGQEGERFRKEFEKYNSYMEGLTFIK